MKVVVLGAGPSGLAAAYYLRQRGVDDITVVDRLPTVGGCSRTSFYENIPYEFGPQIMFTNKDYLRREFERFLTQTPPRTPDGNYNYLLSVDGTLDDLHNFPITTENILKLPNPAEVIYELYNTNVHNPDMTNFEAYCLSVLGPTVYRTYVKGYTEKAWQRPAQSIDTDWVAHRPLRLQRSRSRFEGQWQGHPGDYNPMWRAMASSTTFVEGDVKVDGDYNYSIDGERIQADLIISSLPLRQDLEFVNTALVYVVLKCDGYAAKSAFTTFPNNYTFARLFEYKQQFHVESEYSLVSFDFPYLGVAPTDKFIEEATAFCRTVLGREVVETWIDSRQNIYPLSSRENMQRYNRALEDIATRNVVPTGRAGMHAYISKDTCLRMGMEIAEHLDDLLQPGAKTSRLVDIRRDLH